MEEATTSKFNINVVRDLYVHGEPHHVALVQKLLKGYYFLHLKAFKELPSWRDDTHFVLAAVDFTDSAKMQAVARLFSDLKSPLAHGLLYAVAPNDLTREQLLFAQEIGARYVAAGPGKNDELKEYLKRLCLEAHQVGSLAAYEDELEAGYASHDHAAVLRVVEKLRAIPHESEEATRLIAIAYMNVGDLKRAEASLRKLLVINPQNLWAANHLGRLFLRSGRGAQGIEVLQKMSAFHELNGERLLTLGDAYVQCGETKKAEETYRKGDKVSAGTDPRFHEGLAKVKLADKDYQGALQLLGNRAFTHDVISFLNMRAIMSIRNGGVGEGLEYYRYALDGAGDDNEVKAKLKFNMGLAFVRADDLEKAQECFHDSCVLGGPRFQRAKKPLDVVKNVLKNKDKPQLRKAAKAKILDEDGDELEWETLY